MHRLVNTLCTCVSEYGSMFYVGMAQKMAAYTFHLQVISANIILYTELLITFLCVS